MQLDIFEHSRDVMLRSDVVGALERREPVAAHAAWQILRTEFPANECLPALEVLLSALERPTGAFFADHAAAREARRELQQQIEPAARRMLGQATAAGWLALQWQALAQRAAQLPFHAEQSEEHAAPLSLRAGDWQAATAAVARIDSWRRIPAPLQWMAEGRYCAQGLDATWPLLAELAWLSPARFDALNRLLRDPVLQALHRKFKADYEGSDEGEGDVSDLAWFPAWVLTEKPALAHLLSGAMPSLNTAPEQAMRLILELLRLERQGRHPELVERRKTLRSVGPSIYRAYMRSR